MRIDNSQDLILDDGGTEIGGGQAGLPAGHIDGFEVSTTHNNTTFTIATGRVRSKLNTADISKTDTTLTVNMAATGAGGRHGTLAIGIWYAYVIKHGTSGTVSGYASQTHPATIQASDLPSGYTEWAHCGAVSCVNSGTGALQGQVTVGRGKHRNVRLTLVSLYNHSTVMGASLTLDYSPYVPATAGCFNSGFYSYGHGANGNGFNAYPLAVPMQAGPDGVIGEASLTIYHDGAATARSIFFSRYQGSATGTIVDYLHGYVDQLV